MKKLAMLLALMFAGSLANACPVSGLYLTVRPLSYLNSCASPMKFSGQATDMNGGGPVFPIDVDVSQLPMIKLPWDDKFGGGNGFALHIVCADGTTIRGSSGGAIDINPGCPHAGFSTITLSPRDRATAIPKGPVIMQSSPAKKSPVIK